MRTSTASRLAALSSAQRVELLRRLVAAGRMADIPGMVPPREGGGPARLGPAQEDLWVYEALYPASGALNLCCSYHFDDPVDPADLETALALVQADHDILRARIAGRADSPRLEFCPEPLVLERADLRAARDPAREARKTLAGFGRDPFPSGGRLFQGLFIRTGDERATLALKLHHIITDWWSFDILHADFSDAYRAVREGTARRPRRPAIQYADYASWQRELQEAGVFDAQLSFWRDYLAAPPPPLTVTDGPMTHGPMTHGPMTDSAVASGTRADSAGAGGTAAGGGRLARVPFEIDRRTEAAVRALARELGATVYGVLMTAFAVLAHRLSGQRDVLIGTPIANRSAPGLDRVIGYVMNAVPTRWRIDPGDTFAGLTRRFATEFPRILGNADVPVGRIVTAVGPRRLPGRSPLFQWVFMYLPAQRSVSALREFCQPERIQTGGEHDLVGVVQDVVRDTGLDGVRDARDTGLDGARDTGQDKDQGMTGALEFRTDVYTAGTVRPWATALSVLLAGLLAEPHRPVGEISLLSPLERPSDREAP